MPLEPKHRNLLVLTISGAFPNSLDFKNQVTQARPNGYRSVPMNATAMQAIELVVDDANGPANWIRTLVEALHGNTPTASFKEIIAVLDQQQAHKTSVDHFEEVFLPSRRPFVNRRRLRAHARDMLTTLGERLLLVQGGEKTGKSFSEHLLRYIAQQEAMEVHRFAVKDTPEPESLAAVILQAIDGSELPQQPAGVEAPDRLAVIFASSIGAALKKRQRPCFMILDEFPPRPLPAGLCKLVSSLAKLTDDDRSLRLVIVGFAEPLPQEQLDVALVEEVAPFTAADMVDVVMKLATARQWSVGAQVVKERIDQQLAQANNGIPILQSHFTFLRSFLGELAEEARK